MKISNAQTQNRNRATLVLRMAEVTYTCKRTVGSTKPVQPGKYNPLSVLDRQMEKTHLRMVYYFRSPVEREGGEMTKRLRECLSETLTHFPVVTGRLIRNDEGHWTIKCNDAGIRMVEARAKGSVEEWLKNVDREKELKLVHWEDMFYKPYFWSTFYVQLKLCLIGGLGFSRISPAGESARESLSLLSHPFNLDGQWNITEFEEGGLAIGLSCFHLLADPTCATMFIKAWADITLAQKMMSPPFFHPLPPRRPGNKTPNHKPYTSLINHYKTSIEKSTPITGAKYTTITLLFPDHMVRACVAMARSADAPNNSVSSPSPFEALSGLIWVCVSKLKGIRNGLVNMSICLDARKVLGLDKGFFGNCMVYNKVHPEGVEENELSEAARAIGEVVAKMDNERIMDLIEWLENNDSQSSPLMNGCDLICGSLEGVDQPYIAAFEDGVDTIRVSYYAEPVFGMGQVLIFKAPPSEGPMGRVAVVTLPEDEVVKLCEDELILHFSPTILMGVNKK